MIRLTKLDDHYFETKTVKLKVRAENPSANIENLLLQTRLDASAAQITLLQDHGNGVATINLHLQKYADHQPACNALRSVFKEVIAA